MNKGSTRAQFAMEVAIPTMCVNYLNHFPWEWDFYFPLAACYDIRRACWGFTFQLVCVRKRKNKKEYGLYQNKGKTYQHSICHQKVIVWS